MPRGTRTGSSRRSCHTWAPAVFSCCSTRVAGKHPRTAPCSSACAAHASVRRSSTFSAARRLQVATRGHTALYPGTVDPVRHGHLDIVRRAALLFERVIVAVADSPRKGPLFALDERVELVRAACADLPGVEVRSFSGLLAREYHQLGIDVVIKG